MLYWFQSWRGDKNPVSKSEALAAKNELLDLTEMDDEGRFKRNIIKTLDPHQYRIDISKYFL